MGESAVVPRARRVSLDGARDRERYRGDIDVLGVAGLGELEHLSTARTPWLVVGGLIDLELHLGDIEHDGLTGERASERERFR